MIGGKRESRRVAALVAVSLLTVLVAAGAARAVSVAQPKPGCWGTCGGPEGPVDGYFTVAGGHVQGFEDSQTCLGTTRYGTDYLRITDSLPISAAGGFTFSGSAIVSNVSSGRALTHVPIVLSGEFTSPSSAAVKLTITDARCGTKALTVSLR